MQPAFKRQHSQLAQRSIKKLKCVDGTCHGEHYVFYKAYLNSLFQEACHPTLQPCCRYGVQIEELFVLRFVFLALEDRSFKYPWSGVASDPHQAVSRFGHRVEADLTRVRRRSNMSRCKDFIESRGTRVPLWLRASSSTKWGGKQLRHFSDAERQLGSLSAKVGEELLVGRDGA